MAPAPTMGATVAMAPMALELELEAPATEEAPDAPAERAEETLLAPADPAELPPDTPELTPAPADEVALPAAPVAPEA
jgi:hypothetical protein